MLPTYAEGHDWMLAYFTEQSGPVSYSVTVGDTSQTCQASKRYLEVFTREYTS